MSAQSLPRVLFGFLLPIALCSTLSLYLYPILYGCAFPSSNGKSTAPFLDKSRQSLGVGRTYEGLPSSIAPFRLLVLADPQLEGDSSLPDPQDAFYPRFLKHWDRIKSAEAEDFRTILRNELGAIITRDIPDSFQANRKRLDLFGNDYYLAHIYRTLHTWTKPTHVTVLGDLIGSQWVTDEEFDWRGWRYWNRVFSGASRVEDRVTASLPDDDASGGGVKRFNLTDGTWSRRVINIAGNHDIGYAGDVTPERMARFERVFGAANWDVLFEYPSDSRLNPPPSIHLIVLNSLILDSPALSENVQSDTYAYINSLMNKRLSSVSDRSVFNLLLTHVPLYKPAGVCSDGPAFEFWNEDDGVGGGAWKLHGLKTQNHLSEGSSRQGVLESLFGMSGDLERAAARGKGRHGLILTGHDHQGCDVWHYIPAEMTQKPKEDDRFASNSTSGSDDSDQVQKEMVTNWQSTLFSNASSIPDSHTGVREITLRSMMGEYSGNAGLLSMWYDFNASEWRYEIMMCPLGVQHYWWATHVIDLITVAVGLAWVFTAITSGGVGRTTLTTSVGTVTGTTRDHEPADRIRIGRDGRMPRQAGDEKHPTPGSTLDGAHVFQRRKK